MIVVVVVVIVVIVIIIIIIIIIITININYITNKQYQTGIPYYRQHVRNSVDEKLSNAVTTKINDGNIKLALRLLQSNVKLAKKNDDTYKKITRTSSCSFKKTDDHHLHYNPQISV